MATKSRNIFPKGAYIVKTNEPLSARTAPVGLPDRKAGIEVPSEFMIMPAGKHEITATQAGEPVTLTITVNEATAEVLERSRQSHTTGLHRPFFDFSHECKAASAWPTKIFWKGSAAESNRGVYARVLWSSAGFEAINGRVFRAFSPTFYIDGIESETKVVGAPFCMGSLVNDPAFTMIEPIWASNAQLNTMNETTQNEEFQTTRRVNEPPTAKAPQDPSTTSTQQGMRSPDLDGPAQKLAQPSIEASNIADSEELARLRQENAELNAARVREIETRIETALNAATVRGAIPPHDQATRSRWHGILKMAGNDGFTALAALPPTAALTAGRLITGPVSPLRACLKNRGDIISRKTTGMLDKSILKDR